MKIVRRIAATLALCGMAFFTNMAHAGDCGTWQTEGYWVTTNVEILRSGSVPPASGPGTSVFVTTGETYTPQSCGGPADNGDVGAGPSTPAEAITFFINAVKTLPAFCKSASETCQYWGQRMALSTCKSYASLQSHCNGVVAEEVAINGCSVVTARNS